MSRDGYKKIQDQTFITLTEENPEFEGIYLGCKEVNSSQFGQTQICWIVKDIKDGVLKLLPEKTQMEGKRLELRNGDQFLIVYMGEQKAKSGSKKPYKVFDVYIKE